MIIVTFHFYSKALTTIYHTGTKQILHDINGRFPPGQLIAIMGPSGAGKSTLLDILSGYRIRRVSGTVRTNGVPRNLKTFRKSSCYIQQDDRLQPLLTTSENMQIAADLKLPPEINKTEKNKTVSGKAFVVLTFRWLFSSRLCTEVIINQRFFVVDV